jgi:Flp pilus assembly pilin Flp
MKKMLKKKKQGQAMVEYIIIVVVVAIAALLIFGVFSDTLRQKLGGAVEQLGGDSGAVSDATDTEAVEVLQDL